jgi:hypothetical protein
LLSGTPLKNSFAKIRKTFPKNKGRRVIIIEKIGRIPEPFIFEEKMGSEKALFALKIFLLFSN